MSLYNQNLGKIGEDKAASFLKSNQFFILKKNFYTPFGEIDIIAKKEKTLYFIEVKTRKDDKKGKPYEAVNFYKLKHLKKAVNFFLLKNKYLNYKMKIGIISIILDKDELKFYDDLSF